LLALLLLLLATRPPLLAKVACGPQGRRLVLHVEQLVSVLAHNLGAVAVGVLPHRLLQVRLLLTLRGWASGAHGSRQTSGC
jgi:hypothetical protein